MLEDAGKSAVLVVDDEPLIRMVAADMLSDEGIPHYEANDADEALAIIETQPAISVLFTDINMPGSMDGLALARRVHELKPELAIIVTSGRFRIPECDLPDDGTFLPKPYTSQQLVKIVQGKLRPRPAEAAG